MKYIKNCFLYALTITFLLSACLCSCGQSTVEPTDTPTAEPTAEPTVEPADGSFDDLHAGMTLTFEDNFDGDSLDTSKWELCPEWQRQDLGAYWSDTMTSQDGNGNLILSAGIEGNRYTSGAIRSRGLFAQKYGYFEIRCKLPTATGLWSAFWLMCDEMSSSVGNGGTDGAEIDIMESAYPRTKEINHAVHWDGYGENLRSRNASYTAADTYDGNFHTFALEWTESEYVFYVDGEESWRTDAGGICQVPLYLKVTTEFGSWAGEINDAELPAQMIVDYVRVYVLE